MIKANSRSLGWAFMLMVISIILGCSADQQSQSGQSDKNDNPQADSVAESESNSALPDAVLERQDEPADSESVKRIEESLLSSMSRITESQDEKNQQSNVDDLETLSEEERQALIDTTIEQSSQLTEQEARALSESLEELKEIEHAPIEGDDWP